MILTVAMNPKIVRTIHIDGLQLDTVNSSDRDELSVGDCGVYSAYVIKVMQGEPYVIGLSGGIGGRYIKNFLDRNRIKTDFLQVDHETKSYIVLNDTQNDTKTVILSHNDDVTSQDYSNIKHKVHNHLGEAELVMISGSDSWCAALASDINRISNNQERIIASVEGPAIVETLKEDIFATVLDTKNLEALGMDFPEDEVSYQKMSDFRKEVGLKYLFVTGKYEIVGFTKNKICKVHYHAKDTIYPIVKSMVLGGLTIGIKRGYNIEKNLKLMGAIANNCSINEYPFVIRRNEIDRGIKHSRLYEIYNNRQGFVMEEKDIG